MLIRTSLVVVVICCGALPPQGFASGDLEADAISVRVFENAQTDFVVAQSFAKNFGLYCERVGMLHVVCSEAKLAEAVLSQMKLIARPMYSSPPAHGARILANILTDKVGQVTSHVDSWLGLFQIKRVEN